MDDFTTIVAIDALIRHKPDLFLLHLIDTDSQKHDFGPDSAQARDSLARHDERIGRLLQALQTAGTAEETEIIIFSDHGCLPVHTTIEPDDFLAEKRFYHPENGSLPVFDAYFHSAGGTAFLRICNTEKSGRIKEAFAEFLEKPFVSRILTDAEMKTAGMADFFDYGVVAAEGYSFGSRHLGQHGYTIDREGYYPFYLAAGSGIPETRRLPAEVSSISARWPRICLGCRLGNGRPQQNWQTEPAMRGIAVILNMEPAAQGKVRRRTL